MSLSANMRDDTGRRAKTVKLTAEEEELRIQLQSFEARYDTEDADQVAVRMPQPWVGLGHRSRAASAGVADWWGAVQSSVPTAIISCQSLRFSLCLSLPPPAAHSRCRPRPLPRNWVKQLS